jgi:hypothetical protein
MFSETLLIYKRGIHISLRKRLLEGYEYPLSAPELSELVVDEGDPEPVIPTPCRFGRDGGIPQRSLY